jgi:disulfide bond formation protein DsbB
MATIVQLVTQALSVLAVALHLGLILFLLLGLIAWLSKARLGFFQRLIAFIRSHALPIAFIFALTATSGSLFFSEIAHYEPCELCWFQRIFMYPQVILLGIALWKKDTRIYRYIIPLCLIGGSISAYHYTISTLAKAAATGVCSATGPSCVVEYFTQYGYITLPMMALTAFFFIAVMAFQLAKRNK